MSLIGGPVTVLPPDTRHVDLDVIPSLWRMDVYTLWLLSSEQDSDFAPRAPKEVIQRIKT